MNVQFTRKPARLTTFLLGLLVASTLWGQNPAPCSANWWAKCCVCATCLVVEKLPKFGYCRHCNLLCPDCRKNLGNLDSALSRLKAENRALMEKLRSSQRTANEQNAKLTDALIKTYGQEAGHWTVFDPASWRNMTGSGFNSSLGKFATASASLLADFNGAGLPIKILVNVISTAQSEGAVDAATNLNGILFDILTEDKLRKAFENEMILNAGQKFAEEIRNARNLRGAAFHQAFMRAKRNFMREARFVENFSKATNKIDFGNTLLDIYQFIQAGADVIANLYDIYDSYRSREDALKDRLATQNQIVKNVKLMACIRETKDSLNNGGLGRRLPFAGSLSFALLGSRLLPLQEEFTCFSPLTNAVINSPGESFWEVDTFRVKAAITQIRKLQAALNQMIRVFADDVVPPLIPWTLQRHEQLSAESRISLLKSLKTPLDNMVSLHKTAMNLSDGIEENMAHVISGQEVFYLTDVAGARDPEKYNTTIGERWIQTANGRIKGEVGRINMSFPPDAEWSIDFYSAGNKFVGNRSKAGKKQYEDFPPGKYLLKLNSIPVENVGIEKGKETKLKVGFLELVSPGDWELYSESKQKYYTSGNKPAKLALPVGNYVLDFGDRDFSVQIRERVTVRFELPVPVSD
ncbi:MAG TPA: hypothetical protein VEB63_00660 [Chitinophagaceae bacterium]|nr:hypothetical protein [Chitinophagaceae bacterium]